MLILKIFFLKNIGEKCRVSTLITILLLMAYCHSAFSAQEFYRLKNAWPSLPQPWTVSEAERITTTKDYIFLLNKNKRRLEKLTKTGRIISYFNIDNDVGEKYGQAQTLVGGEQYYDDSTLIDIASDDQGYIYLLLSVNNHAVVVKYSVNGIKLQEWVSNNGVPFKLEVYKDSIYVAINRSGSYQSYESNYYEAKNFIIENMKSNTITELNGFNDSSLIINKFLVVNNEIVVAEYRSNRSIIYLIDISGGTIIKKIDADIDYISGMISISDSIYFFGAWNYVYEYSLADNSIHPKNIFALDKSSLYESVNTPVRSLSSDGINLYTLNTSGILNVYNNEKSLIYSIGESNWDNRSLGEAVSIANDKQGYVYIADSMKEKIKKFDSNGTLINEWGGYGYADGQFVSLRYVYFYDNKIYASDNLNRIQVFNCDGLHLQTISLPVSADKFVITNLGEIWFTTGGSIGYLYRQNKEGNFESIQLPPYSNDYRARPVAIIAGYDNGPIYDIEIHSDGNIYISRDSFINIFDVNGEVLDTKNLYSLMMKNNISSMFYFGAVVASSIAFDDEGNMYFSRNNFIYKINHDFSIMDEIYNVTIPSSSTDIKILNNEILLLSNHSLKVYQKKFNINDGKALLVLGGQKSGNALWDASFSIIGQAYYSLSAKGYEKKNINILSDEKITSYHGDFDGYAIKPSIFSIKHAITEWATDSENLLIYLIGHGGNETFQLSSGEVLSANQLSEFIDEYQNKTNGKVTIIYDACSSGSFIKSLSNNKNDRLIITSAKDNQNAYFLDFGSISFSDVFWKQIMQGKTLLESYEYTAQLLNNFAIQQAPQLNSDSNSISNQIGDFNGAQNFYINNSLAMFTNAPEIESIDYVYNDGVININANDVNDDKGIMSVWTVVFPPGFEKQQVGDPFTGLPLTPLKRLNEKNYSGSFIAEEQGTYRISVYAKDTDGNISPVKSAVVDVSSPFTNKVIVVSGCQKPNVNQREADFAFDMMKIQGVSENNIKYLSCGFSGNQNIDELLTADGLKYSLLDWADGKTNDLIFYLAGDFIDGKYYVDKNNYITMDDLEQWLYLSEKNIKGNIFIIHEGSYSGKLVAKFATKKMNRRIVIGSTGINQINHELGDGDISFSYYFWNGIGHGNDVSSAFRIAQASMRKYQYAQIDANDNGQANEKDDTSRARAYKLGLGLLLAADEPKIGSISPNASTSNQTSALWVDSITSLSPLKKVWAVITPPGYNPGFNTASQCIELDLHDQGNGRWQATYGGFARAGEYQVSIYALDNSNRLSAPRTTYVTQTLGSDGYEADDDWTQAKGIAVNTGEAQWRNFHQASDVDYIRFDATPTDGQYTLEVKGEGVVDTALSLYDSRGQAVGGLDSLGRLEIDDMGAGDKELILWQPPQAGTYYLKIRPVDSASIAVLSGYQVRIFPTVAPQKARIRGRITNANGQPIAEAAVWVGQNDRTTTDSNGNYILPLNEGSYDLHVETPAYEPVVASLKVQPEDALTQDIELIRVQDAQPELPMLENTTDSIGSVDGDRIQDMYIAYYGRPADPKGLEYWVNDLHVYNNLHTVLSAFGQAQEYTDRFGHYSDTELVNAIYQRLFNRDAEPGGLDYWVGTLRDGSSSLVEIALQIVNGAQGSDRQIMVNKREVSNVYTLRLRNGTLPLGLEKVEVIKLLLDGVGETGESVKSVLVQLES